MKHDEKMNNKCPWCESEKAQINLWLKDEFLELWFALYHATP